MKRRELFDVLAVDMKTRAVRVMAENRTRESAESFVTMAVARRGVEHEFFVEVPAGSYDEGEVYGN
jgi:hypothetical protein